jgi:hypothetical protein
MDWMEQVIFEQMFLWVKCLLLSDPSEGVVLLKKLQRVYVIASVTE